MEKASSAWFCIRKWYFRDSRAELIFLSLLHLRRVSSITLWASAIATSASWTQPYPTPTSPHGSAQISYGDVRENVFICTPNRKSQRIKWITSFSLVYSFFSIRALFFINRNDHRFYENFKDSWPNKRNSDVRIKWHSHMTGGEFVKE